MNFVLPREFHEFRVAVGTSIVTQSYLRLNKGVPPRSVRTEAFALRAYEEWRQHDTAEIERLGFIAAGALQYAEEGHFESALDSFTSYILGACPEVGFWLMQDINAYLSAALFACLDNPEEFKRLMRFFIKIKEGATR